MQGEIDYSGIAQPVTQLAQEDWEPPVHKFFGKKLPGGKTEKEPKYVHQEYPRMMYGMQAGKIRAVIVNSDEEKEALGENWATNPAAFGHLTAPSFDQVLEMRRAKEALAESVTAQELIERATGGPTTAEQTQEGLAALNELLPARKKPGPKPKVA